MCGLTGIWHPDLRAPDVGALSRMTSQLAHRGPDDAGIQQEPGIGLGHRRLSIIDLETGHQPLCNEDRTVWVVFNGEIFNYPELRADLIRRGHVFKTQSDTEVLVHLYEEHGLDFVDALNGQFAIALWDRRQRRLVLVRDRVGIRPLFHATLPDGTLLFASEMKAILAHGALRAEVDPVALGQIATLWVTIPPRTPFKGVEELGPGRMLVVEPGRRFERRYWQHRFPRANEYEEHTLDYWKSQVRETLEDAVRLQLRADVPVAAYLSGGLDSSILTGLIQRQHEGDLTTFSVAFEDSRFDEAAHQDRAVAHFGTRHRSVRVNAAEVGRTFPDVIWFGERPTVRTAPGPLLRLSGLVRRHETKVVLTGEGADELFAGYNLFREDKARRFWARNPGSQWRASVLSNLYGYVQRDPRGDAFWQAFFRSGLTNTDDPFYSHRLRWQNGTGIRRFFSADVRAQMQSEEAMLAELEAYLEPDRLEWHPLCRAQHLEMMLFMSGYLLSTQGDRMMMASSVEGRVPFLDHRLIELAARIPPKYKLKALKEKHILKEAFRDLLPASITDRPKQPYRAPIFDSLVNGSDLTSALLEPQALADYGLADPFAVEKLMKKLSSAATPSERDEMALAMIGSVQLLHHQFVSALGRAETRQAA